MLKNVMAIRSKKITKLGHVWTRIEEPLFGGADKVWNW